MPNSKLIDVILIQNLLLKNNLISIWFIDLTVSKHLIR